MPELLQQIETMSDAELEQLIEAARAKLEQRHDQEWDEELSRRALHAKENGFPGRPFEEVLDEMERASKGNIPRLP